ncbi:MAG: hypothetical protein V3V78_00130 [Candidatus Woesearchaeota archaeon]
MKKVFTAILAAILLIFCVATASAAVSVESTFDSNSPLFGGSSQMASNSNADDEVDENIHDTGDVTLNSTAAVTVTSITVVPESGFTETELNITLDDADLTLAANVPEAITLKARIPENLDAVDSDLEEVAFKVATVTINFNTGTPISFDVYMQRKNMLDVNDVEIKVNDDDTYDEDDTVDEVKPGSYLEISVEVENTYDEDDDDVDIDVELKIDIDDDSDFDIDDGDDVGLDAEEEGTLKATIEVESDADDEDYDMFIDLEADDAHGAKHGVSYEVNLKIERKSHDVVIKSLNLGLDNVECSRDNSIFVKIENIGKRDEDEVSLYLKSDALDIDFAKENFDLDENDDYSKTLSFNVPADLNAGTYLITASVYYSGTKSDGVHADEKDIPLYVQVCGGSTVVDTTPSTPTNVGVTDDGQIQVTVPDAVLQGFGIVETYEEDESFTDSTAFIVLLSALVIALLGGEAALIVWLVKK